MKTLQKVINLDSIKNVDKNLLYESFSNFIEIGSTATERGTFYDKKEDIIEAVKKSHQTLFEINRGIYAISLLMDGTTDFNKIIGITKLLHSDALKDNSIIDLAFETRIIQYLTTTLPIQRRLKLFKKIKELKINNSRTRNLILYTIFSEPNKLEWWSVKYRKKIYNALEHAWGKKLTSIIGKILYDRTPPNFFLNEKEFKILKQNIEKYVRSDSHVKEILPIICFILNNKLNNNELSDFVLFKVPIIRSFIEAKTDIKRGTKLPREVLEGIRSTYHKDISSAEVLELTKGSLSETAKLKVQKSAEKHGVSVSFNIEKQTPLNLYIHSYANGDMTSEIKEVLDKKAKEISKDIILDDREIGILLDASKSQYGSETQPFRPIALSQVFKDVLMSKAKCHLEITGGANGNGLLIPEGDTDLGTNLIKLIKKEPDSIFILTDGYENSSAGRVNEIIEATKKIGLDIKFFQITPTTASESSGIKKLSKNIIKVSSSDPKALNTSLVLAALKENPEDGLKKLLNITTKKLELWNK